MTSLRGMIALPHQVTHDTRRLWIALNQVPQRITASLTPGLAPGEFTRQVPRKRAQGVRYILLKLVALLFLHMSPLLNKTLSTYSKESNMLFARRQA